MGSWGEGLSDWGRRFGVVGRSLVMEAVWVLGSWVSGWGVGVVVTDRGIDRLGRVLSVEMLGSIIWGLGVRVAFSGWEIHSLGGVELLVSRVRSKGVGVAFSRWEYTAWADFSPSRPSLQPALETLDLAETWCDLVWLELG